MLHQIGAGALGPVFRAYQPEQDRLVAVKLFRLDLPPERTHQLVKQLERLIAADLTHPSIATALATGISDVSAYLAMDFVAADSLDIVIREQQITAVADIVRIVTQLASALDLAAAIDINHGALHPRDVLLSGDEARITGIGIARALEACGVTAPIRRPYSAPERAAGIAWDRRADVFSLAALTFELLTRRRIVGPGDQPSDAFSSIAGVSGEALDKVFDRALAERPMDRFPSAGDFAKALQAAIEKKRPTRVGTTVKAPPPVATSEPVEPLPAEELPLFTDSMLGENSQPAGDATPPPLVDASHEALGRESAFTDVPGSMAESLHESGVESTAHRRMVIDDLHSAANEGSGHRLSIDDFHVEAEAAPIESPGDHVSAEAVHPVREDRVAPPHELSLKPHDSDVHVEDMAKPTTQEPQSRPVPFEAIASAQAPMSSGVWPLMLALVVGIALGFGMAMLLLGRDRAPQPPVQASAAAPAGRNATDVHDEAVREVTEQTVTSGPKVVVPPPAEKVTPPPASAPVPPAAKSAGEKTTAEKPAAAVSKPQLKTPVSVAKTPATKATTPAKSVVAKTPVAASKTPVAASRTPVTPSRGAAKPVASTPKPASQAATPAKPEPGSLVVDSRPAGANVFLDGKRVGSTPLVMDEITVGEYTIGLDLTGYKRWATTVKITSGQRSRVAASLER